ALPGDSHYSNPRVIWPPSYIHAILRNWQRPAMGAMARKTQCNACLPRGMHMQKKRGLLAVSLFGFGAAALICSVSVAAAAQTVDGYEYKIHSAVVEAEELGKFPPDYPDAITRHFRQGPRHTLMWGDLVEERTPDNASFARGERRLGLLIPHWPAERRAT